MRRSRVVVVVVAALLVTIVPGCAWWGERSGTTKGAVYGTGAGAAAGAAIGAALGGGEGAWKGAAVGAAVGALGGGLIGNYMDRQKRDMEKVLANQDRIEREGDTLRASLSSDVLFESGSARLQAGADTKLLQIAEVLQRYPRTYVEVTGHTDNRGTESFNEDLSERRAQSVRDNLVKAGVDGSRITTRGEGERKPVAGNDTATGRATNRRVDITIRPDEGLAQEQRRSTEGAPPPAPEEPH
jgi:outer membrane protein OmpA-like peptidoglycan-associated protein